MAKAIYMSPKIYPLFTKNLKKTDHSETSFKSKRIKPVQTFCRNSVLLPCLLGKTFNVHNGKTFFKVIVSENIIGHKLGEFSQSRRRYFFKKGKKTKQKGKK